MTPDARYATLFFGFYEPADRTLRYCNAGHQTPLLLRRDGIERLEQRGLPIGMFEAVRFSEGRARLEPGDLLALYTDGVCEAPNEHEEEYGDRRLGDLLRHRHERDLDAVMGAVLEDLGHWTGDAPPHDDMTLVLARCR